VDYVLSFGDSANRTLEEENHGGIERALEVYRMKHLILALLLVGLFSTLGSAQGHDPTFILGGYGTTSTLYWNGIWLGDTNAQTLKHLTPSQKIYYCYSKIMDANNKDIILTVGGTTSTSTVYKAMLQSGLYRLDPGTMAITTVLADSMSLYYPRRTLINQDGDYVFQNYYRDPSYKYAWNKLDQGSTLTTIFSSLSTGDSYLYAYGLGKNMDTGNYLMNGRSPTMYYAVWDVADDGTFTTFAGGPSPAYGWYGYYANMQQNFDTGSIEGKYGRTLYRLKKGALSRTTLWNLGYGPNHNMDSYSSVFDLQSAASKKIWGSGYYYHQITSPTTVSWYACSVYQIDPVPPYGVIGTSLDPNNTAGLRYTRYTYGMDFYRGRHIQTVKKGTGKWDLNISCPKFPNKAYVAAVSMAGYRPPIPLPSGRKIYLVPDILTGLSLGNLLKPFFDAGPGTLDAGGEAKGSLDLSTLPKLGGVPIWIAVAVLDAAAPDGMAYLPDTYVFRIP